MEGIAARKKDLFYSINSELNINEDYGFYIICFDIKKNDLLSISEKLSYDTLNANTQEQDAENIIESTEKSLFNLAGNVPWAPLTPDKPPKIGQKRHIEAPIANVDQL